MIRTLILSCTPFILLCCTQPKPKANSDAKDTGQSRSAAAIIKSKERLASADVITNKVVVLYFPDSADADAVRARMGEDNLEQLADENAFYTDKDREFLKSQHVETLTDVRRDYTFRLPGGVFVLKKNQLESYWGGIIFNGKDTPVVFSGQELEDKFKASWK